MAPWPWSLAGEKVSATRARRGKFQEALLLDLMLLLQALLVYAFSFGCPRGLALRRGLGCALLFETVSLGTFPLSLALLCGLGCTLLFETASLGGFPLSLTLLCGLGCALLFETVLFGSLLNGPFLQLLLGRALLLNVLPRNRGSLLCLLLRDS